MSNAPITLSRERIRDTFLTKRHAKGKPDGLILRVYNQNMRIPRSGQLMPYISHRSMYHHVTVNSVHST